MQLVQIGFSMIRFIILTNMPYTFFWFSSELTFFNTYHDEGRGVISGDGYQWSQIMDKYV